MERLTYHIGPELVYASGDRCQTKDFLDGKTHVAVFTGAHWNQSKNFVTKLADLFPSRSTGLEFVICSFDESPETFQQTLSELPFPAIPFEDKTRRMKLTRFLQVTENFQLSLFDINGSLLRRDCAQPFFAGEPLPWAYPTLSQILQKYCEVDPQTLSTLLADPNLVVGLYFGSSNYPNCSEFAEKLDSIVQRIKQDHSNSSTNTNEETDKPPAASQPDSMTSFCVVAVPCERTADEQAAATAAHPHWLPLSFEKKPEYYEALINQFRIEGLPTLPIMRLRDNRVLNPDAVSHVLADLPWARAPLSPLNLSEHVLNSEPCILYIGSNATSLKVLEEAASADSGADAPRLLQFLHCGEGDEILPGFAEFCGLPDDLASQAPLVLVLDLPRSLLFRESIREPLSAGQIGDYLEKYRRETLPFQAMPDRTPKEKEGENRASRKPVNSGPLSDMIFGALTMAKSTMSNGMRCFSLWISRGCWERMAWVRAAALGFLASL